MSMPRSKAKTPYGLLSEICKLIMEEPLRYNQGLYIARPHGAGGAHPYSSQISRNVFPSCGTVGCVAGWTATLRFPGRFAYGETGEIATQILGLNPEQANELFAGAPRAFYEGNLYNIPQTAEHARAGVRHIRAFQKKYARQLRNHKLEPIRVAERLE